MNDWEIIKRYNDLFGSGKVLDETIRELFSEYQCDKDRGVLKEDSIARTLLIMGNVRLVHYIVGKKMNLEYLGEESEEFSVGKLGLIKAVDKYDPNSGFKFSSYAAIVIRNEVLMYCRSKNKMARWAENYCVSLDDCFNCSDGDFEKLTYEDALCVESDFVQEVAEADLVERVIKNLKYLTPEEQIYISYYYGLFGHKPINQAGIANVVHKTRAYVADRLKSAREKLRLLSQDPNKLSDSELSKRADLLKGKYKDKGICKTR